MIWSIDQILMNSFINDLKWENQETKIQLNVLKESD